MENLRNGIDVKLVSNKKDYLKWTSKPSCMPHKIFDSDLVAIKNKCGNNSRLLFIDTDSLMYEIKTEDLYKDFSNDKEMFDFSII